MSFPSALAQLNAGASAPDALMYAMEHDTPLGFAAIVASASALTRGQECPCCIVKQALPSEHHKDVLRHERRGKGVIIDFAPDSAVGKQVARLMGTDAARPLLAKRLAKFLGFANCCKVLVSADAADVVVTSEDQVRWQESIDC